MNLIICLSIAVIAILSAGVAIFAALSLKKKNIEIEANNRLLNSERENERNVQEVFREQLKFQSEQFERRLAELDKRHAAEISELHRKTSADFELIAAKTIRQQTEQIKKLNDESIDNILDPLRRKIDDFNRTVTECYVNENASRKSLSDQLERLMKLNMTIGEEARQLTSALKGDSKVQGDWGEMILETILENAGLSKGVNFLVQPTTDLSGNKLVGNDGKGLRPDIVLLLPDNHRMIIDSKVSLTAYVRLCEADNKQEADLQSARHLESVKRHIDELAAKQYPVFFPNSFEHTMMFIPNEGAYLAAVKADSQLWKYAFDKKIVMVSPTHIFSVMQIVAQLWRQDAQNKNAAEIAKLGGLLYDKFTSFLKEFQSIEKNLDLASRSYSRAYDNLTKGSTSIVSRAERLRNLGAKASKRIPEEMINSEQPSSLESIEDAEHGSSNQS